MLMASSLTRLQSTARKPLAVSEVIKMRQIEIISHIMLLQFSLRPHTLSLDGSYPFPFKVTSLLPSLKKLGSIPYT